MRRLGRVAYDGSAFVMPGLLVRYVDFCRWPQPSAMNGVGPSLRTGRPTRPALVISVVVPVAVRGEVLVGWTLACRAALQQHANCNDRQKPAHASRLAVGADRVSLHGHCFTILRVWEPLPRSLPGAAVYRRAVKVPGRSSFAPSGP